jgi:hypothetical protein
MLVHDPLGTIAYAWPIHWRFHLIIADRAYERLATIHNQIEQLPPNNDDIRLVFDEDLLVEGYACGTSMVSNAVRTIRHLAREIFGQTDKPPKSTTAPEEIREATQVAGIDCRLSHPGYDDFGEIVRVRDAIEHPDQSNVYQDRAWEQVPLAWLLSHHSLKGFVGFREWLDEIAGDWASLLATEPGATLTVERGMRSRHSAKKPKQST